MPARDPGTHYVCFKCSTQFNDMGKPDPLCPSCGADQRESPSLRAPAEGRRGRLASSPKVIEPLEAEGPEATPYEEDAEGFEGDEEPENTDE